MLFEMLAGAVRFERCLIHILLVNQYGVSVALKKAGYIGHATRLLAGCQREWT